ncbi:MAG TPA: hypothetical protein VF927_09415 [Solirubrobacteraceae bacterium]
MRPMGPRLAIAALICAAALSGCGGSSKSSSSGASSSSAAPPTSRTSSTPAQSAGSPSIKEAVAECKRVIKSQTKLPASAKTKLEGACSEAAKGNSQAVKSAAREVCEEVIEKAALGNSAVKEEALKACKK